ncbi:MAG: methyltransferase domain-containing protein, partial [Chloroflexi bacterium]|nr:methyltransferase domain-containing protein [Chloroflexota bacterium]
SEAPRTDWNAAVYDRIGTPMRGWAQQVIDDLELRGDETVLDAGCGSGSVTLDLLRKLPDGKVYAVDSSPEMTANLAAELAERGITNVVALTASLADFTLPEQVDAVFSNAVFHWVPDDDGLFGSLARATKPGGRLRAQCGGAGNIARLTEATHAVEKRAPYREHFSGDSEFRKYRSGEEARSAMERNGWRDVRGNLFEAPVTFEDEDAAVLYLRTIILQHQAAALPEELSGRFLRDVVAETVERFGAPFCADYVRLDLWATRAG